MYIGPATLRLVDAISKENYGKTPSELNATVKQVIKEKDATVKQMDATVKQTIKEKDVIMVTTITQLFVQMQMTSEAIAQIMGIDQETVVNILRKQKLIKK
jgi:hypothetical protein